MKARSRLPFMTRTAGNALLAAAWLIASPAYAAATLLTAGTPAGSAAELSSIALAPEAQAVQRALLRVDDVAGSFDAHILAGVRAFYEGRGFAPAWIKSGTATRQTSGLRDRMASARDFGLDPAAYRTSFSGVAAGDPEAAAAAEVAFSRAVASFVTHLGAGRIDPGSVSSIITLDPQRPDIAAALDRLSGTASVGLALTRFEPPFPAYRGLKARLAELTAQTGVDTRVMVPDGALLKPGESDERIPILRERLGLAATAEPKLYDSELAASVRTFQAAGGLTADGIVGPQSLLALNGVSREAEIATIVANMERWRWMPRDLGAFHVFVNVPEFTARVVQDGATVHETRVVVGAPKHETPTFSSEISYFVVNPFWNVPTSILSKEMLPEIQRNPYGYFERRGYQVLAKVGGKMRVVDPDRIDWWMVNPRSIRIRQTPGDDNALGRIKFMFPNQHAVYLHDTPSKALFKKDFRAYSHGCVRVDNPLEFADALLSVASPDWNSARLEKLYGGPERRINLKTSVPVHLAYFTLAVDPSGTVRRFGDVYGYDAAMTARLAGADAKVASISP